jgi:nicotinamide mononucleotide transporter
MMLIESIAVLFGVICVWLAIRQNIWCWPTGLVQVSLYIYIFYSVKLYSDVILHVVYVGLQIYGWYHWLHGGRNRDSLHVVRMSGRATVAWIGIATCGTLAWGYAMASMTDASLPYGDAFTTVTSLCAQWLMARKRLESWLFWIGVDVAAVGIYFYKELLLTSGLYGVFLCMASAGFIAWRRSMLDHTRSTDSDDGGIDARQVCAPS